MEKILIIEDDQAVQRALKRLFETEGYSVDIKADGKSALEAFRAAAPAAIILDLRLPALSGKDVCREIKRENPELPIVVLSATTDVADKVLLLELGADDYVTKPFSPKELLARVRATIRRTRKPQVAAELTSFDAVSVDFARMQVRREDQPVTLTAQEFKILKFFVQNAERVISRDELLQVLGYQNYPSTRTIDNHILKLRQKLEKDSANPVHFRTVHGAGYKFVP